MPHCLSIHTKSLTVTIFLPCLGSLTFFPHWIHCYLNPNKKVQFECFHIIIRSKLDWLWQLHENYSLAHFHNLVWCLRSQHLAKIHMTNDYPSFVLSCGRLMLAPSQRKGKNMFFSFTFEHCIHIWVTHTKKHTPFQLLTLTFHIIWNGKHVIQKSSIKRYITESYLVCTPFGIWCG